MSSTTLFLSRLLTEHVDPHVYPHFNLYPARAAEPASREENMTNGEFSVPAYPFLVVCAFYVPFFSHLLTAPVDPHVYPHFNLYPARAAELASREEVTATNDKLFVSSITYPFLVICEFYITFFLLLFSQST